MTARRCFVSGEGANEIGSLVREPPYDTEAPFDGVVQALVKSVAPETEIIDGLAWRHVPKLRVGMRGQGVEARVVRALRLRAKEAGSDALVFLRDRDGNRKRAQEIEAALEEPGHPAAGGVCIERLESWLLALAGVAGAEGMSNGKVDKALEEMGIPPKDTAKMVQLVEEQGLDAAPPDAKALRAWLAMLTSLLK